MKTAREFVGCDCRPLPYGPPHSKYCDELTKEQEARDAEWQARVDAHFERANTMREIGRAEGKIEGLRMACAIIAENNGGDHDNIDCEEIHALIAKAEQGEKP